MEVMNINQIKTAWKKGYGYKEGSGTHKDFTDMMAKKTVTSRACKQIVQQYGDVFAVDGLDKAGKLEEVDVVKEDVRYEVEQNANMVEFEPEPSDDKVIEIEASEIESVDSSDEPEFMK